MSLKEIDKLKAEKADLIEQFISIKKSYQELFYKHEEVKKENKSLKQKIHELQNSISKSQTNTNVSRENQQLQAKVNQMRRSSSALIVTPRKTLIKTENGLSASTAKKETRQSTTPFSVTPQRSNDESKIERKFGSVKKVNSTSQQTTIKNKKKSTEYEVERILKHRGRKGQREFLLRWKNYGPKHDTWAKENALSCPTILERYKTKHNIA